MRIDFGASYKDVSRLLRASNQTSAPTREAGFEKSLGSLLNPTPQVPDITSPSPSNVTARDELHDREDMRASYKAPEPELEMPVLESQMPPLDAVAAGEPPASPRVKAPTLLEVKRVEIASDAPTRQPRLVGQNEVRDLLHQAGQKYGIDPALSMAVVKTESDFNPRAVSADGHASKGLFQLLDSTGKDLLARNGNGARPYDPFDPDLNIELGTSYLRYLHDIFSTSTVLPNDQKTVAVSDQASREKLAVAAFNAGEGRVASAQHRAERAGKDPAIYEDVAPYLPRSTREYVARVSTAKGHY